MNLTVAITVTQTVVATKVVTMVQQVAAATGALVLADVPILIGAACLVQDQEGARLLMAIPIQMIGISKAEEAAAQALATGAVNKEEVVCLVQAIGDSSKAEAEVVTTSAAICHPAVGAQCLAAVVLSLTVVHNNLVVAVRNLVTTAIAAAMVIPIKVHAAAATAIEILDVAAATPEDVTNATGDINHPSFQV